MIAESCLLFLACSVFGWIWEVFLNIVVCGTYVNRGMLYGPWLPIYGFGALMVLGIALVCENPFQVFIVSAAACGILEYVTSLVMENIWKMRWWNYTGAFNVRGRINLLVLLVFGCIGLFFYYVVVPNIAWFNGGMNRVVKVMTFVLLLILMVDYSYSWVHPNVDIVSRNESNIYKDAI